MGTNSDYLAPTNPSISHTARTSIEDFDYQGASTSTEITHAPRSSSVVVDADLHNVSGEPILRVGSFDIPLTKQAAGMLRQTTSWEFLHDPGDKIGVQMIMDTKTGAIGMDFYDADDHPHLYMLDTTACEEKYPNFAKSLLEFVKARTSEVEASRETASTSKDQRSLASPKVSKQLDDALNILARDVIEMTDFRFEGFDAEKAKYGLTKDQFVQFCFDFKARFSPSASAGQNLTGLNDHAGVLVLAVNDDGSTVAERLTVMTDTVQTKEGRQETRYFVKGYRDRIVNFNELRDALRLNTHTVENTESRQLSKQAEGKKAAKSPETETPKQSSLTPEPISSRRDSQASQWSSKQGSFDITRFSHHGSSIIEHETSDPTTMETAFRSMLWTLSEKSDLMARRNDKESDSKLIPLALNRMQLPSRGEGWANAENYMPHGAGPRDENGFYKFYLDYNRIENRMIIFKNESKHQDRPQNEQGHDTAVNIAGRVLAQLVGIKSIEVMGPAGKEPGVHNAKLKQILPGAKNGDATLRITMEDASIHELVLDASGIKMSLVNPQTSAWQGGDNAPTGPQGAQWQGRPSTAFNNGLRIEADVDVYTYNGSNTGVWGSKDGFPNSTIVMSTGEPLLAGPLIHNRSGVLGNTTSIGQSFLRLLTLQPNLGESRNKAFQLANMTATAVLKASEVYLFNQFVQFLQARHDNDTILGGDSSFSAVGSGSVNGAQLAAAIASMVFVQEGLSTTFSLMDKLIPGHWKQTGTRSGQIFMKGVVPASQEFTRLMLNWVVQKFAFGFGRGGGQDVGMLAAASAVSGIIQFTEQRSGNPENHPWVKAGLFSASFFNDTLFRSLGNVMSKPDFEHSQLKANLAEAFVARLLTRGADKLVTPLVAILLDQLGIIGPHASAFDHQVARETRYANAISFLKTAIDELAVKTSKLADKAAEIATIRTTLNFYKETLEKAKQAGNRLGLTLQLPIPSEVTAAQKAGQFPDMSKTEQEEYLKSISAHFVAMTKFLEKEEAKVKKEIDIKADKRAREGSLEIEIEEATSDNAFGGRVTNSRSELIPGTQEYMKNLEARLDRLKKSERPDYPVKVSLDQKMRPIGTKVPKFGFKDTDSVPLNVTTFSRSAQGLALGAHNEMVKSRGASSILSKQELSGDVKKGIELAIRRYTIESQFFHYPLRWPVTGQPKYSEIAPGIHIAHNVMNKPGNVKGDSEHQFDPVESLYINLGALYSETFPAVAQRAVGTEAPYLAPPLSKDAPADLVVTGDIVALTEILSATMSSRLAGSFGNALGFGAAGKEYSQRIVMRQETAINITKYTDLVQAELIEMPGALFTLDRVDKNAGRDASSKDSADRDIGQVIYFNQVDTAKLEEKYHAYQRGELDSLTHDDLAMHPETGHFYRYDQKTQTMQFANVVKNYFLGRKLERDTKEESGELARARFPWTSDYMTRTLKDAVNAAILRGDPIVPYLDDAVKNVHHEYFRKKAGYYQTAEGKRELEANRQFKNKAGEISSTIGGLGLTSELNDDGTHFLAWLMTGMLRQPIRLVPMNEDGTVTTDEKRHTKLQNTYDRVNLSQEPEIVIGVGKDGYYVIRTGEEGAKAVKVAADGTGRSIGNMLHALYWSGYATKNQYTATHNAVLNSVVISPGSGARKTINQLLDTVKRFAATDYLVLQKAMAKKNAELANGGSANIGTEPPVLDTSKKEGKKSVKIDIPDEPKEPTKFTKPTLILRKPTGEVDTSTSVPIEDDWNLDELSGFDPRGAAQAADLIINAHNTTYDLGGGQSGSQVVAGSIMPTPVPQPTIEMVSEAARNVQEEFGRMLDCTPQADSWMLANNVLVATNSGTGLNCLIMALLQHATGNYAEEHTDMARQFREALKERHSEIGDGMLYSDDPAFATLVGMINEVMNTDMNVIVVIPGENGPAVLPTNQTGTDQVAIMLGRNGLAHYEALTMAKMTEVFQQE